MIEQIDHVCAHTPATAAQRRAALTADATVLANRTFGRDVIAALQGRWHADDEVAELRFTQAGEDYWLALDAVMPATRWRVGHVDTMTDATFVVLTTATTTDAAMRLRSSLAMVRAEIADVAMPHMANVFDAIRAERERQNATWGQQDHDPYTWLAILSEEVGELSQAILHNTFGGKAAGTMREELLHVAAVACQWLECVERMTARAQCEEAA